MLNLGSEVRLEKLVELFVIILGKVDRFLLAAVLAVHDQVGVVVEDPLDLHVRILVDTAPLLEEPLDAGQPIEPSGVARDHLARLVSNRAMQRQQRERQRSPPCHARWRRTTVSAEGRHSSGRRGFNSSTAYAYTECSHYARVLE